MLKPISALLLSFVLVCFLFASIGIGQDDSKSRTVTVEGIGSTFEAAKKDAFRNAISQVVGTIVDAETRVEQEKVLEQILTASNAYVEEHKILSQKKKDGLWHVEMKAKVESRALQIRLGKSSETTNVIDGTSLLGRIETRAASEDEPVLLLAKVLRDQNFPYSVMEATVEMVKDPVERNDDHLVMQFNVTVKPNAQKFDEFRKSVEPVLEKLAISQKNLPLRMKQGKVENKNTVYIVNPPGENRKNANDTAFVHINSSRNNSLSKTDWTTYELTGKATVLLTSYASIVPVVEVGLLSANDEAIASKRIDVGFYGKDNFALFFNCTNVFNAAWKPGSPMVDRGSTKIPSQDDRPIEYYSPSAKRHFFLSPFFARPSTRLDIFYMGSTNPQTCLTMLVPEYQCSTTISLQVKKFQDAKGLRCKIVSDNPEMDDFYSNLPKLLESWRPNYK